nr:DUF5320 domain-containing protein [uncultured Holophaga sp.]
MPRYDGTGPMGQGSRTGFGRGNCAPRPTHASDSPGAAPLTPTPGQGLRRGGGRGMGPCGCGQRRGPGGCNGR